MIRIIGKIDDLPASVREIAEIIGRDKALLLVGGLPAAGARSWRRVLYVPKTLDPDGYLVRVLGSTDAEAMRRHFGGSILQPGNCGHLVRRWRDAEIARMARAGWSASDIADVVGVSESTVIRVSRQGNPPEDDADGACHDTGKDRAA